ncbi:hypothetical protein C2G38_2216626 [Gigaspora rosea]|uniref:GRF-type domain-containing protein n=1 Tax=Gigaspora rosea TaxID=44941 RepID=A0A397UBW8_9GLOM|nr:hypothetical protein C2G38_2216626 [Gigaspora rosea]
MDEIDELKIYLYQLNEIITEPHDNHGVDCNCSRKAKMLKVKKNNRNKGKLFFICFRSKCDFFEWYQDENNIDMISDNMQANIIEKFFITKFQKYTKKNIKEVKKLESLKMFNFYHAKINSNDCLPEVKVKQSNTQYPRSTIASPASTSSSARKTPARERKKTAKRNSKRPGKYPRELSEDRTLARWKKDELSKEIVSPFIFGKYLTLSSTINEDDNNDKINEIKLEDLNKIKEI